MKNQRKFFFLIFALLILSTFNPGTNNLIIFPIKKINIISNEDLPTSNYKDQLAELFEKDLRGIDIKMLKKKILDSDYLEIRLKKKYPNSLNVIVNKKNFLAIYNNKNEKYFVLDNNNIIQYSKIYEKKKLPNIFGDYKDFPNLILALEKVNFKKEFIKDYYYFEIGRWDLSLKNGKTIKLPTKDYDKSIINYQSLDADIVNNYSTFDYRIDNQLILK